MRTMNGSLMRGRTLVLSVLLTLLATASGAGAEITILSPKGASGLETLAAREAARYVYLRMNRLPAIREMEGVADRNGDEIVIARKDRPALATAPAEIKKAARKLKAEHYLLKTIARRGKGQTLWIVGGDDVGTLYGAYRFAEALGVRFYLHGDVIPDTTIPATLPRLAETGKPLFDTRGIQPFHDFPEGPDWWDRDDYLSYIGQLPKLRMNFIGLHCYPEGAVGPEPAVWIGLPGDLARDGRVRFSYPSQWASTARPGMWGYAGMKTSDFRAGSARLFAGDAYGPAVQKGLMPRPQSPAQSNRLFNETGAMLRAAFAQARLLGVKTCIGTETPLTVPKAVQARLKALGKDPQNPAVARELYEGMFQRIARLYPVDYYWLWTPEDWTWGGNKPEQYQRTVADIQAALAALKALGDPFTLATCGWVLGPQNDRAALDKVLPKNVPMSCINRVVGHAAVEPGFAAVQGRPKWAIPWMENDPNMVAPQPWVGRMRYDAASALKYGCTGLLGIHWRTKILAPNVAALAGAAWDQSWVPAGFKAEPSRTEAEGGEVNGGQIARFSAPVQGTTDAPVYQSVRYSMQYYLLKVPNGSYDVTLQFNEPHHTKAGARVFDVKLQGKPVAGGLDLFARVGRNKALDLAYPGIAVKTGTLRIEFVPVIEYPCIAGIVVKGRAADGKPFMRKINCGGEKYQDYEADNAPGERGGAAHRRAMPVQEFYLDFARANFGPAVAARAGAVLARIDGANLPEPSAWLNGPGGVKPNPQPWDQLRRQYRFVEELAALRPGISSVGELERFDYWLDTYRFMAAMAEAGCRRGELDGLIASLKTQKDPARKKELAGRALRARLALARAWERMLTLQVQATDTPGELGTLANLEQHSRIKMNFIAFHDTELVKALGRPLPVEAEISMEYRGRARLAVPAVRTLIQPGERLTLKVLVPAAGRPATGEVRWRPMGQGGFKPVALERVGRAVYRATLPAPPAGVTAIEYYVSARIEEEGTRHWPATAPRLCQTVVIGPRFEKLTDR